MDNEAGMEHISRLNTRNVDVLLIVTDSSRRGLQAGLRIHKLAKELNISVQKSYLIMNRVKSELLPEIVEMINNDGLQMAGTVPEDDTVYTFDLKGQPTIEMDADNPAVKAAFTAFDKIFG